MRLQMRSQLFTCTNAILYHFVFMLVTFLQLQSFRQMQFYTKNISTLFLFCTNYFYVKMFYTFNFSMQIEILHKLSVHTIHFYTDFFFILCIFYTFSIFTHVYFLRNIFFLHLINFYTNCRLYATERTGPLYIRLSRNFYLQSTNKTL